MELTSLLALVGDGKPIIQASGKAERGALDLSGTDGVVGSHVFIENFQPHIVSDVLDVYLVSLVPDGGLSSVVLDSRLITLLSVLDDAEGIHFTKPLSIASELSLHNSEAQFTGLA